MAGAIQSVLSRKVGVQELDSSWQQMLSQEYMRLIT